MPDNPHRIVIELKPSNRFSTKNDRHLAEIVHRRIRNMIARDGMGTADMVVSVHVETTET